MEQTQESACGIALSSSSSSSFGCDTLIRIEALNNNNIIIILFLLEHLNDGILYRNLELYLG